MLWVVGGGVSSESMRRWILALHLAHPPSHTQTGLPCLSAGPKEKLDLTAVSQPAIYVASLAALEKLKAEQGEAAASAADVCAGLSLGEYTALTYAGASAGLHGSQ